MTATQTQLRRGTASQCDAMTPAEGEVVVDLTNDRLRLGDGVLAGGIVNPNAYDLQKHSFDAGTAGGTGNAVTLTLSPAPAGYTTNMAVTFKATAANTGAATINLNSLGAKALEKVSGGAVTALASGDITSGGFYTAWYDGTKFIVAGSLGGGVTSVSGSGGVSVSGSGSLVISIDTNNALGVGSYCYFKLINGTVAAGATTAAANLRYPYMKQNGTSVDVGASAGTDATISGTWRNVSGMVLQDVGNSQYGHFIRVS